MLPSTVRLSGVSIIGVLALAVLLASPSSAEAQIERDFYTGMQTGVGYAGAFPDLMLGVGAFHLFSPGGFGVMADFKMNHQSIRGDRGFNENFTSREAGEVLGTGPNVGLTRRMDEWMIFNAGVMKPLTQEFAVFAGAGAAYRERFDEYTVWGDDDAELPAELHIVENEEDTIWMTNLMGGVFLRLGQNVAFRMGYEFQPRQLGVGAYWVF